MSENRNYPAFPRKVIDDDGNHILGSEEYNGLTKREYFVAKAMQGMIVNNEWDKGMNDNKVRNIAQYSIEIADHVLDKLEQEK